MRELIRTNDAVLLSFVESLLRGAGIEPMVLDRNMSVMEGTLGILPQRVLVADEHIERARQMLSENDIEFKT